MVTLGAQKRHPEAGTYPTELLLDVLEKQSISGESCPQRQFLCGDEVDESVVSFQVFSTTVVQVTKTSSKIEAIDMPL